MKTSPTELRVKSLTSDGASLLVRCGQGDASALGALFDRYHTDVYRVLARRRGRSAELDDLVQASFLALPAAARGYDPSRPPLPFILGVALHQASHEGRRFLRRMALWLQHEREIETPPSSIDPEQSASVREELAILTRALRELPEAQCEAILLVEVEGLSGEDAAQALGIPINTLWTRIHYGRAALRAAMEGGAR